MKQEISWTHESLLSTQRHEKQKESEKKTLLELREKEKGQYIDFFEQARVVDSYFPYCGDDPIHVDFVYLYQDRLAISVVHNFCHKAVLEGRTDPPLLLDVGSLFNSVVQFSLFVETTFLEPRNDFHTLVPWATKPDEPVTLPGLNLTCIKGEAQNIPIVDKSYDIITSLHAIEHFGLGRYGDTFDYFGDQKGLKEYKRVLRDNGLAILSVPVALEPQIEFNRQRTYTPELFDQMVENAGFEIVQRNYIHPFEVFHTDPSDPLSKPIHVNGGSPHKARWENYMKTQPDGTTAYLIVAAKKEHIKNG